MNDASARCKTASERRPAAERGLTHRRGKHAKIQAYHRT
jgi:hypothetical protein